MKKLITSNQDLVLLMNSILPNQNEGSQIKIVSSKLSFRAFIPNRNKLGNFIHEHHLWVEATELLFKKIFGGFYNTKADSSYVTEQDSLVLEDTEIFNGSLFSKSTFCEREALSMLIRHLVLFGISTQQESVLFSINNVEKKIII